MLSAKVLETCFAVFCVRSPNHTKKCLTNYRWNIPIFSKKQVPSSISNTDDIKTKLLLSKYAKKSHKTKPWGMSVLRLLPKLWVCMCVLWHSWKINLTSALMFSPAQVSPSKKPRLKSFSTLFTWQLLSPNSEYISGPGSDSANRFSWGQW